MLFAVPLGDPRHRRAAVGAQIAFDAGVIVSVVYAFVAGVVALLAHRRHPRHHVAFERANTREAFARFVPESVVDEVLRSADGLRLGGVRARRRSCSATCRGFT